MSERRPTNSELHLQQLEEQEQLERENRGILELFDDELFDTELSDTGADEPLARDDDA